MESIPASAIVSVTPTVLAAGGTALDLSGLILTTSSYIPTGKAQGFSNASDVGAFFGLGSPEKAASDIYFQGFDNSSIKPGELLFASYASGATQAWLRSGYLGDKTLSQIQSLTGNLLIPFDGWTKWNPVTINLSAASSFSSAATIMQTAFSTAAPTLCQFTASINGVAADGVSAIMTVTAVTAPDHLAPGMLVTGSGVAPNTVINMDVTGTGGPGTYWVTVQQTTPAVAMTAKAVPPSITYDSVHQAFIFKSGIPGAYSSVDYATGTLAAPLMLGPTNGGTLNDSGSAPSTPSEFMEALCKQTQNWASFTTLFATNETTDEAFEFARWTSSKLNRYVYVPWDTDSSPTQIVPAEDSLGVRIAEAGFSGIAPVWMPQNDGIQFFLLGAIASLNFEQTNGRATFAFRSQPGLPFGVTSQTVGDNLIANGYNFYGAYATANDQFVWFYPGLVSGEFKWLDSYVNQIWMNNDFQLVLMVLLQNSFSIPYNTAGYAMIEAALNDTIISALNFGAIRTGIPLSASQVVAVNNAAGVEIAPTLASRGWYLQVKPATPEVRAARGSPPCTFWYMDGGSIQKIALQSVMLQ